jgi:hypothetical protein
VLVNHYLEKHGQKFKESDMLAFMEMERELNDYDLSGSAHVQVMYKKRYRHLRQELDKATDLNWLNEYMDVTLRHNAHKKEKSLGLSNLNSDQTNIIFTKILSAGL